MSRLHVMSPAEKRRFDLPPVFTKRQRPAYFAITEEVRYTGRFFERSTFRQRDITYLKGQLNIKDSPNLELYSATQMARHQQRILSLLGWSPFDNINAALVAECIQSQAQNLIKPESIFASAIEFCWQNRIEMPTRHRLANVIADSFNIVENHWLGQLKISLSPEDCAALDALLDAFEDTHSPLRQAKQISQSVRVSDILSTPV